MAISGLTVASKSHAVGHRLPLLGFCVFLCVFALSAFPAHAGRYGINYTRNLSYGFRDGEDYYFILEYRVWQRRRPIWFIMPIERGSRVFFHEIYLYRYRSDTDRLEQIATLRDSVARGTSINDSRFVRTDEGIAFSYITGISKDLESMHDVFILDTAALEVRHAGPARTVPRDSALFRQYFAGYKSPFTDNPGVVGITELKTVVLRDVDEADWGLPRRW